MTESTIDRDDGGRWAKGNPGGPGRPPKRSPLHRAISDDEAVELWRAELALAQSGDADARRYVLAHKQGRPIQAVPDCGNVAWPEVMQAADLSAAVSALLGAHARGDLDAAALQFLSGVLMSLAKVIEVGDVAQRLRQIEEHIKRTSDAA